MHNTASPKGNHMENAQQPVRNKNGKTQKLPKSRISFWVTPIVFLIFFIGLFTLFAIPMGLSNMLSTVMNTAFALLTDTCLYIMAIAVIMGAVSALLTEFGVVAMLNHLLSPLMKPIYGRCCRSRHSHNLSFRQSCNSFSRGRSRFSQVLQEISALRPD
mgnify:CR=1 FL=1